MIGTKLFRRHYVLTAVILVLFAGLGLILSQAVTRYLMDQNHTQPTVFFAKLIDEINQKDRSDALRRLEKIDAHGPQKDLTLLSADGEVIYPDGGQSFADWSQMPKPTKAYEEIRFDEGESGGSLTLLPGETVQYLYVQMGPPGPGRGPGGPGPGGPGRRPPPFFIYTIGFLILSILLGAGLALHLIFRTMNEKIVLADSVIEQLKSGNLKARFPVTRTDEIGQVMMRFNKMADEIQRLVEQLRNLESSRAALLQELTHDLRTPVASLKNLLETLHLKRSSLSADVQNEFFELSLKEVDYFERLVEDLLILAQVDGRPAIQSDETADVAQVLNDEVIGLSSRYKNVRIEKKISLDVFARTDVHLLRRLFRNALDNAFSFAVSEVKVELKKSGDAFIVRIQNDGAGFSEDILKTFGERRVSRKIGKSKTGRLSVGLGSVIMKKIVDAFKGQIQPSNAIVNGQITGAILEIHISA